MPRLPRAVPALVVASSLVLLAGAPALAAPPGYGPDDPSSGFDGIFIFIAVLAVIGAVGGTIWKVSTARTLAKRSGMDPNMATKMTLFTDDGLDATYLAANLRHNQPQPGAGGAPATESGAKLSSATERPTELKSLLDQGLITHDEYDARRKTIIDAL